jgi:hypothetical protein
LSLLELKVDVKKKTLETQHIKKKLKKTMQDQMDSHTSHQNNSKV